MMEIVPHFEGWSAARYLMDLMGDKLTQGHHIEFGVSVDRAKNGFVYAIHCDDHEIARVFRSVANIEDVFRPNGQDQTDTRVLEQWERDIVEQLVSRYRLSNARG